MLTTDKLDRGVLRILSWIASISYSIYLLHQHIGYAIIWRMEQFGLCHELYLIIPIAFILLLAWGGYRNRESNKVNHKQKSDSKG